MKKLAITGDSGELIAMPLACLYNWLLKLRYEVRMWWKSLRISSECQSRRLMASIISAFAKIDTTLRLLLCPGVCPGESPMPVQKP
jgi:hypothetical protein